MRVGIVGGGITGLVAGYRLKQNGANVTIFEAADRVGGPIHSFKKDGYLAESGPNSILETSEAVTNLIKDLGIGARKLYADPSSKNRYIVRDNKLLSLPTSPQSFITSKLFSVGAKLRLMREPFVSKAKHDESLADFVRRRLGQEFLDYAINPFVAGVYAGDPEQLSTEHAFPKLFAIEQKYGSLILGQAKSAKDRKKSSEVSKQRAQLFSFDDGLQVLIDALANELADAIKVNVPVQSAEKNTSWRITDARGSTHEFDKIILTAPAYKLATLNINCIDLSPLAEIVYPPVTSLVLGFNRADVGHPLEGFGMLVPAVEHFNILGTVFSSSLFPNRAPKNHVTLTTYIGGMRQPEHALYEGNKLIDLALIDLRKLLNIHGEPTFIHRTSYAKAIPQYTLGYEKYKQVMSEAEENNPGLHFAGNFRNGISVGDSIKGATELAAQLASH
jgi:protoporphyrinogen/coproporphyrinogen III oxidase